MPDKAVIGCRIKNLREKAGLSQQELANLVGVDRSTIAMYEAGQRIPRDDTKKKLSENLGESIENIFFAS